jgi:hypothetical protein
MHFPLIFARKEIFAYTGRALSKFTHYYEFLKRIEHDSVIELNRIIDTTLLVRERLEKNMCFTFIVAYVYGRTS